MQAKIMNLYFEFEQIQKNLMVFQKNFQQFLLEHSHSKNESAPAEIIHPTQPPCNEPVSVVKLNISNTIQPIKQSATSILDTIANSVDEEISESLCEDEDGDEDYEEDSEDEDDVENDPDYVDDRHNIKPIVKTNPKPNPKPIPTITLQTPPPSNTVATVATVTESKNPVLDYVGIERTFNMKPDDYEAYHAKNPNTFFKKICDGLYAVYHYKSKFNDEVSTAAPAVQAISTPVPPSVGTAIPPNPPSVEAVDDNTISISSFQGNGSYLINIIDGTCTCPHHVHRNAICKHMDYLMNTAGVAPFSMVDKLYNNLKTKYNNIN